jgi:hypothetical protein
MIFAVGCAVTAVGMPTAAAAHKVKAVKGVRDNIDVAGPTISDTQSKNVKPASPVQCDARSTQPMNGAASDPVGGAQIEKSSKGSGRVTFQPFTITRKIDRSSPILLERPGSGCP